MAVRTYAPVGQTPVLNVKLTRDHLSAMGGITPEGRIFMQMQDHSYKGPDVVRFLQLLTREIAGNLLVIWDGAPIHRCQVVKDYLRKGGARRIHLEQLPAYAPERESAGRRLELAQARRAQEPLLSGCATCSARTALGQRTLEASQVHPFSVFRPCWLFTLVFLVQINRLKTG